MESSFSKVYVYKSASEGQCVCNATKKGKSVRRRGRKTHVEFLIIDDDALPFLRKFLLSFKLLHIVGLAHSESGSDGGSVWRPNSVAMIGSIPLVSGVRL